MTSAPRRAAAKGSEAADAVLAWLQTQSGGIRPSPAASERPGTQGRDVREGDEQGGACAGEAGAPLAASTPADRGPAMAVAGSGPAAMTPAVTADRDAEPCPRHQPLRLCHTDWLHHRLMITGPDADLAALRTAASGAGTVPWQLDFDRVEEDLFHLLAVPPAPAGALSAPARSLSLAGARILAGQLRDAAARRHALAIAQVGHSRACPFDLQALIPVPDAMLRRGPDDPAALAWLWTHWGTTQTLRHVAEDAAAGAARQTRAAPGEAVWVLTFWSADWTPWRALAQLSAGWPTLRFDARPTYDGP